MNIEEFIEENLDLIDADNWKEIYKKAENDLKKNTGEFTEFMLEADIHPERYLKELPNYFLYNSSIKEFEIFSNVTSIGDSGFENCTSLRSVTIPNSVTTIGKDAFRECTSIASITIPNGVTSIGKYAFLNCTSLTSVIIPDSVSYIGPHAFEDCGDQLVIDYSGSKEDWRKIYNPGGFVNTCFTVNCTDGKIVKSEE